MRMFVFVSQCVRVCVCVHAVSCEKKQHQETTRDQEKLFVCLSAKMGVEGEQVEKRERRKGRGGRGGEKKLLDRGVKGHVYS